METPSKLNNRKREKFQDKSGKPLIIQGVVTTVKAYNALTC
jgi:hypothetical protein